VFGSHICSLTREYEIQLRLYRNIRNTTVQLHSHCREADFKETESIDILKNLFGRRQNQMNGIIESQITMSSVFHELKSYLGLPKISVNDLFTLNPSQDTANLTEIATSLEAIASEIVVIDSANQELLQSKLAALKEEALKLSKGRKAGSAYKPAKLEHEGIFIDKKPC